MRAKALVAVAGISFGFIGVIGFREDSPPEDGVIDGVEVLAESAFEPPAEPFTELEGARFVTGVEEADPQHKTVARAWMNEYGELGLILNGRVDRKDIPKVIRSMMMRTAADFPGQDLTIITYAPVHPPLKIGTARFDADTRVVTYSAALP